MQNCQSPALMSEWMTIISARDAGASENGELENAKFLAPSLQRAFKSQCCSCSTVHLSLSLCCFPLNPLEIVQSLQTSEYQIGPWYSKAWPNHYISFPVPTFVNSSCNLSLCSRAPLSVTFGKITWMFKYSCDNQGKHGLVFNLCISELLELACSVFGQLACVVLQLS